MAYGGEIVIKTKLETKDFEKEFDDLKKHYDSESIQSFVDSYETASEKAKRLKEEEREASKAAKEIADNTEEIVEETKKSTVNVDNLGKSFKKSIKSVGQLVLGIFGIRSAYLALRRASSNLAQYDEQYATNLEYIRFVLTQAIAPVLRAIVNMAGQLLQYIVSIIQTLFGMKGIENSSVEAFNKMKNKAGGVSKAVKEIKKQLTGFDEINILTDQSSSSAGGGGTNQTTMPDFGKKPEWLEKIAPIIAGIAAAVLALKLHLGAIKALGIGIMVYAIVNAIKELKKYIKDPSWENFGNYITYIGLAIGGLALATLDLPLAVAAAIVAIVGVLMSNWDKVKKGFEKASDFVKDLGDNLWKWFFDNIDSIMDKFGYFGVGVMTIFTGLFDWVSKTVGGLIDMVQGMIDSLFSGVRNVVDNIIKMFKGDLKGGIEGIIKSLINVVVGMINSLIDGINGFAYPLRRLIQGLGKVTGQNWSFDNIKIGHMKYVKTGAIINMPNKGTALSSNVRGGESGAEGVIPLTDRQAMETLGETIGRYITINANIINRMNGRTLSREIVQVQNDQSFAYNS